MVALLGCSKLLEMEVEERCEGEGMCLAVRAGSTRVSVGCTKATSALSLALGYADREAIYITPLTQWLLAVVTLSFLIGQLINSKIVSFGKGEGGRGGFDNV